MIKGDLIFGINKDRINVRHGIDQFHAFFHTQSKADRTERIALHGGIRQDRDSIQVVLVGIAGKRI